MALRRQLLLLASLTLALPWAGCEYVKEMEASLRDGQQAALRATTQAVEARLQADPELLANMDASAASLLRLGADYIFYAHTLPGPVVVDGYAEEWRTYAVPPQRLQQVSPQTEVSLGVHSGNLYAYIEVADSTRRFFDPSRPIAEADYVLLQFGEDLLLRLFSAAPGTLSVERNIGQGVWQREHRVSGVWNELEQNYALEVRLPLSWSSEGIALQAHDGGTPGDPDPALVASALLREEPALSDALAVFARPGVRLTLVAKEGWMIGSAGAITQPYDAFAGDTFARAILRRIIGQPQYPFLEDDQSGRLTTAETLPVNVQSSWYRWGDALVAQVSLPIPVGEEAAAPMVALVAEQRVDSLQSLTSGALTRLFGYTAVATLLAGFGLLAYASVLSWRIRRLSQAAQRVVDGDGRIRAQLPGSRSADEIGDLSRSYAALLQRLRHYNEYLESLAGKLSHELRTPLAIVRSSLDNLTQLAPSAEQQVYLDRASDGAARLSRLLNAMSAASRLEQSLQQSELEQVDMADLLAQLVESYRGVYAPRRLDLVLHGDGPFELKAAPELLAQMCDKLIENAADFTAQDGFIEMVLSRGSRELCLQVINQGPPIPETLQGRLFDSLTSGRSGEGGHLGLGLYVVRLIVDFHQGQIRAFNQPDSGTVVFEILLPITRA